MEECQRCREKDEDRRTLWMSCFYDMDELKIPFIHERLQVHIQDNVRKFYTLRVCKKCRADWMSTIKSWYENVPTLKESVNSGIFIREFGSTIEISEEDWKKLNPYDEPVRLKKEDNEI